MSRNVALDEYAPGRYDGVNDNGEMSMTIESWYDKEEERLCQANADGELSNAELQKELGQLQRDYRDAVEEEAEQAVQDVYESHGYGRFS